MVPGTVLHWVIGLNDLLLSDVAIGGFISIIGAPHNYCPLTGFVVLGGAEARFMTV